MPNILNLAFNLDQPAAPVEFSKDGGTTWAALTLPTAGTGKTASLSSILKGTYAIGQLVLRAVGFPASAVSNATAVVVANNILTTPTVGPSNATGTSTSAINVTVSSIANSGGYRLLAADSIAGVYGVIYQGVTASFPHTGLAASQVKFYKWQYVGNGQFYDDSALSAAFSGSALQAQPAAPTNPATDDAANIFRFNVAVISGNAVATTSVPVGSYVLILSEGDSMTAGGQLIGDGRMDQVQANLGTTDYRIQSNGRYYNSAVSGTGMDAVLRATTPRITAMLARLQTAAADPACVTMIVSLRIGINDIALFGRTGAAVYADYVNFAGQVKAVSPKVQVIFGTLPNQQFAVSYPAAVVRTQAVIDAEVVNLNAAIRGGTVQAGIWDSQSLAVLQDPTNTAYFYDKLHLTHAGYGGESDLLTSLIRSLLTFVPRPATTPVSMPLTTLNATAVLIGNLASTLSGGVGFSSGGAGAAFQSLHQYGAYPNGYDITLPRVYVSALLVSATQQIFGLRDVANTSIFYDGPGYALFFANGTMQLRGADWSGGAGALNAGATVVAAVGDVWAITVNGTAAFVTQNGVEQYRKTVSDARSFRFHGNLDSGELADMREFATIIS